MDNEPKGENVKFSSFISIRQKAYAFFDGNLIGIHLQRAP